MKPVISLILLVLCTGKVFAQRTDLTAIYKPASETVSCLLFDGDEMEWTSLEAFTARRYDLAPDHPRLTVSGDFTGNGVDELALFNDLEYTPNLNPAFTCSVVSVIRSGGDRFVPSGSWFSAPDTQLLFDYVSFSAAGDFTGDGLDDIALFYNDPGLGQVTIYLLESSGSGFSDAQVWYREDRNEFNFTALKFASAGDFNGNGKADVAVFYNYFGTAPETRQAVFIFESEGSYFSLLPVAYEATKATYDFSSMKFACPGDYNQDGCSDIAVMHEDPVDQDLVVSVFQGSPAGQLSPSDYNTFTDSEPELSQVVHAAGGDFAGDTAEDLVLCYDNTGTGRQEILVLESEINAFKAPVTLFSADPGILAMEDITAVRSGTFLHQPVVTAALWKDDRLGAISFTFDDGYRGAFEHGGAELEAAGLKGTFYIFTDTSAVYYGEPASTALVSEYRERGHEIASHTSNHADLGLLTESGDVDSIAEVLASSVALLNERFDQNTISMSIPFGSFRYETLEYIAQYFYTARSSQYGFNLATPYDFFALKSWPILSTTTPSYVDTLLSVAETYGTYLPLMYHDVLDAPFDEDSLIYTYRRSFFHETVQSALNRDLWIDTHEHIYKYIRERNALQIRQTDSGDPGAAPGHFSFEADDNLADSVFNVELTLKISLPESWTEDTVTVGPEGGFEFVTMQQNNSGKFIYYDVVPVSGVSIDVYEGKVYNTAIQDRPADAVEADLIAVPNPFRRETHIRVRGTSRPDAYLVVRDLQGRMIQELREHSDAVYRFGPESLPPGLYIVQLIDSGTPLASLKILAL